MSHVRCEILLFVARRRRSDCDLPLSGWHRRSRPQVRRALAKLMLFLRLHSDFWGPGEMNGEVQDNRQLPEKHTIRYWPGERLA